MSGSLTGGRTLSSAEGNLPIHWYYRVARQKFSRYRLDALGNEERSTILYVGGFVLPDGNAAAQRVIANARLFSEIGYNVVFLNYSKMTSAPRITSYFGFECFECPWPEWNIASRIDTDRIEEIVVNRQDIACVVAYNYPAASLSKLIGLCHRKGIACIGDVTEWYRARDVSLLKIPLKYFDTAFRMRSLHPKMDGLIVISDFLKQFYAEQTKVLLLPPLVDSVNEKWSILTGRLDNGMTRFVYAGKPSKTKERLDLIVDAIDCLSSELAIQLDVVGITQEDFCKIYHRSIKCDQVVFHGRVSHEEALAFVKRADYSLIVRDDNLVTRAGFPTKFAESISCGTPVICNDNSDLKAWIDKFGCGFVVDEKDLAQGIARAIRTEDPSFDKSLFDYRNYCTAAASFFNSIIV